MPARPPTDSNTTSWTVGASTLLLLGLAAAFGQLNFARWDNMETFLPAIWYTHSEILSARFPFWNPLQNLGEPMHALGIGGALYPPYTVAVAITRLWQWPEARALDLIAIAHATFGAIGVCGLLTELRVRPSIAFVAALSATLSGYALIVGAIWVHALPNLAWSVWAMWGLRRVIANERAQSGAIVATVALTAVLLTGHVQTGAYVWLAVWGWALGLAAALRVLRRNLVTFGLIAGAAALLAAPAVLPTVLVLPTAIRMEGAVTPGSGFRPLAMLGLLIPVLRTSDGALVHPVLVTTFAGAWVVPGALFGLAVLRRAPGPDDEGIRRTFLVTLVLALILVWLNFGPAGGLYSLLHELPVWSRFRVPYKYFERAAPLLVIAAALGLELAARRSLPRSASFAVLFLAALAAVLWLIMPAREPLALLAGVSALLTLFVLFLLPPAGSARVLVPLTFLQTIALIGITHASHRSKAYTFDRRPEARLPPLDRDHRLLPLSEGPPDHPYTRPLALFYAPMLDGYESASGHRFALTSQHLITQFAASVSGVPSRRYHPLDSLLRSNFLQLADVGYLVVADADTAAQHALARAYPRASVIRSTQARIYSIGSSSPRVFFAAAQRPDSAGAVRAVLHGSTMPHTVVVSGQRRAEIMPPASIRGTDWGRDRIGVRADAPEGGLLVFSTSYSPEWIARADRRKLTVLAIDGIFAGVRVPPGTEQITLSIRRWPLFAGLALAVLGVLCCVLNLRRLRSRAATTDDQVTVA